MHEEAAQEYIDAGQPKKAAREYGEVLRHEKVLATCYYAELYNELIHYMKRLVLLMPVQKPTKPRF
jgi:hypothetical protein